MFNPIGKALSSILLVSFTLPFGLIAFGDDQKPNKKIEPKLVIYDDEFLKGKNVIIRKAIADLNELKFSDKSESIEWELPHGKAFVLYDDKNFKLPVLVLVGKGDIQDLGKERPNALHSITSVGYVNCPKGKNPSGISKDVPRVGDEE